MKPRQDPEPRADAASARADCVERLHEDAAGKRTPGDDDDDTEMHPTPASVTPVAQVCRTHGP